jgi:hypothetical protein
MCSGVGCYAYRVVCVVSKLCMCRVCVRYGDGYVVTVRALCNASSYRIERCYGYVVNLPYRALLQSCYGSVVSVGVVYVSECCGRVCRYCASVVFSLRSACQKESSVFRLRTFLNVRTDRLEFFC